VDDPLNNREQLEFETLNRVSPAVYHLREFYRNLTERDKTFLKSLKIRWDDPLAVALLPCGHSSGYWRLPSLREHKAGWSCGCLACDAIKAKLEART
jgi:hypothetical protein